LTKTAGKLKNRNYLLMKLTGSTWGVSANTLQSSALVLCYSAAEYNAPVRSRSAHTSQVDVQLNSTMRLISGILRSTPLPWLPVHSNIERQPYEGRLPLTSWWRKLLNMTVGQSSLISLTHHCYDWHPGSRCGWTYNQLTSKVDVGITGSRLRWSILTLCATPQSGNRVWTFLRNSGLCWTVCAWNRDTAVPAEGNGDLQTLICVLVARPRRCLTLLNPVPWQNWMAAYLCYTLRMKTHFRGWLVMVHDMHTRRRKRSCQAVTKWCEEWEVKRRLQSVL